MGFCIWAKPRKYELKLNKKVKTLARKSALLESYCDSYKVLNDFTMDSIKTKRFIQYFKKIRCQ